MYYTIAYEHKEWVRTFNTYYNHHQNIVRNKDDNKLYIAATVENEDGLPYAIAKTALDLEGLPIFFVFDSFEYMEDKYELGIVPKKDNIDKLQKGDIVRIRDKDYLDRNFQYVGTKDYGWYNSKTIFTWAMMEFAGKLCTVKEVCPENNSIKILEDETGFWFSTDTFKKVIHE